MVDVYNPLEIADKIFADLKDELDNARMYERNDTLPLVVRGGHSVSEHADFQPSEVLEYAIERVKQRYLDLFR